MLNNIAEITILRDKNTAKTQEEHSSQRNEQIQIMIDDTTCKLQNNNKHIQSTANTIEYMNKTTVTHLSN